MDLLRACPWALLVAGGVLRAEPLGGGAARGRAAVVTAPKTSKARSPLLLHPWHACWTEERRRCGDVLAFSALELLGFEGRAADDVADSRRPKLSPCRSVLAQRSALAQLWSVEAVYRVLLPLAAKTINRAGPARRNICGPLAA